MRRRPRQPKSVVRDVANKECVFHLGKVRLKLTPGTSTQNGMVVCSGRNTVDEILAAARRLAPRMVINASQQESARMLETARKSTHYWRFGHEDV